MKKSFIFMIVALSALAHASVITEWNFEAQNLTPSTGYGILDVTGGVTNDGYNTGYPGSGFGFSTTNYPAQGADNLTGGIIFEVSTLGFSEITVSGAVRHSNTSANKTVLLYTLDKTADPLVWEFGEVFTSATSGDTWFTGSFSAATIPGLTNNANAAFKIVTAFNNANSTEYVASRTTSTYAPGGKLRFDNIQVSGTPANPVINLTANLETFYAAPNSISPIQSYTVEGQNLTGSITVAFPRHFYGRVLGTGQFQDEFVLAPINGIVSQAVQVVFQPTESGVFNGDIVHSGGGVADQSVSVEGTTTLPEPSLYPLDFYADGITYFQAYLFWTDSGGSVLPEGYLIKGSKIGPDEILPPVDGVPEADKKLTKNVPYGQEAQIIFELNETHPYWFKIYPYTNSGAVINYKTDDNPPLVSITTTTGPVGSTLDSGDLAFVEYATDSPDRFSFVLLRDVLENTKLNFTDKAWTGTVFAETEESYEWRGVGRSYSAGEVIHIEEGVLRENEGIYNPDFEGFSNSGDQIIAYQGYLADPNFIAAFSTTNWLETGIPTNSSSYLPAPLTLGVNALGFASEIDNGVYSGPTTGTAGELRALMNDPANWTRSNSYSGISFPDWNITVISGLAEPGVSITRLSEGWFRLSWQPVAYAAGYTVFAANDPTAPFPAWWTAISFALTASEYEVSYPIEPDWQFFRVQAHN